MLYLLDWSGYMFRAYYALPQLTDKNGNNQNAVYGFLRMLLALLKDKPDYFVIARDHPSKTFREKEFQQYKATRPAIPDDFKRQISIIKQLPQKIGIKTIEIPGYEADDIIYTLVKSFKRQTPITIISGDKDLKQLLEQDVEFYDPMKKQKETFQDFQQKRGFNPINIVDYLALVWDSSDNIPWVEGIGPKWAKNLVQQYGEIENIYQNLHKLAPSIQKKLKEGKDKAYLSKSLITLQNIEQLQNIDLKDLKLNIDFWKFKQVVSELSFPSLISQIDKLKQIINTPSQNSLF